MKLFIVALLASFVSIAQAKGWSYAGEFSQVNATTEECESIFTDDNYQSQFHLAGATGRTALLYFRTENPALLNKLLLSGLYGPDGDFEVRKDFTKAGRTYIATATGIVSPQILNATVKVRVVDSESQKYICHATGEYNAFTASR